MSLSWKFSLSFEFFSVLFSPRRAMRSVAPNRASLAPSAAALTASAPGRRIARTAVTARAAVPAQRETVVIPLSSSSSQSTSALSSFAARSPVPFPRRRGRLLVTAALRTEVRQRNQIGILDSSTDEGEKTRQIRSGGGGPPPSSWTFSQPHLDLTPSTPKKIKTRPPAAPSSSPPLAPGPPKG